MARSHDPQPFPTLDLTVRNLAFSADEVVTRQRSENFGSPDKWLEKVKAGCGFRFFRVQRVVQGARRGCAKFKADLDKFLKETQGAAIQREERPTHRAFFADRARESEGSKFPRRAPRTTNVCAITSRRCGKPPGRNGVQFVDLFHPSQEAVRQGEGAADLQWHPSDRMRGEKQLAPLMFKGIFGVEAPDAR